MKKHILGKTRKLGSNTKLGTEVYYWTRPTRNSHRVILFAVITIIILYNTPLYRIMNYAVGCRGRSKIIGTRLLFFASNKIL
jgi:hypothetical protein